MPEHRPALDTEALRLAVEVGEPGSWWAQLSVVESTGSTNADMAATARAGEAPVNGASVLVAEHQLAGRGRLGRSWEAPARSALTMSVLVRPSVAASRWPWLPLLTGLAVCDALRRVAGVQARLKWPNDVLVGERKLAGILLERVETPTGAAAVIGIGLNVSAWHADLPVTATSLALEGAGSTDRQALLVGVLAALQSTYTAWTGTGADAELRAAYVGRCATLGRRVRIELPDGSSVTGRAETVDAGGRLVVRTASGRSVLGAGEVVHVRPDEPPPENRSVPTI